VATAASRGVPQTRAAVLPALRARSRTGEARRSAALMASETPICSMAWGWLQLFAASARARPAARTSPPSGAGLGVGAPEGLGRGIRLAGAGFTRNDLNPAMLIITDRKLNSYLRLLYISGFRVEPYTKGHGYLGKFGDIL